MLPKETEEMKRLRNNHIFLTNQCYNEVIKSTIYETGYHRELFLSYVSRIKFCMNEAIDILSDFETKYISLDVHQWEEGVTNRGDF